MIKPFLISILMLFFSSFGNLYASENSKLLDSLLNNYNKFNNQTDLKNGEILNHKILEIANEENNKKVQIIALNNLSFFRIFNNDFLAGFNYSEQAINIANELKNDTLLIGLYINKSKLFSKTDNIEGAIKYLIKARNIVTIINDNSCTKFYYNSLAVFYYNQKEYNKAILNFKLALLKAVHTNDTNFFRSTFDNIGLCYRNLGNYKLAEYYFLKAIYFAKLYNSPVGLVNASINLSKNFFLNNQLGKAIHMADYAVSIILSKDIPINFPIEISINLAKIYLQKKDFIKTDSVLLVINNLLKTKTALDADMLDYLEVKYKKYKAEKSPLYIVSFENYLHAKDSLEDLKKIKLEYTLKDKFTIAEKLEDYETIEHDLLLKDLQNKWIITVGLIFLAGLIILLYMVFKAQKNIKELKLLQDEVNKQNKNLELYNKQKDYILATVAHDLSGPVGNINTITSVISMDETLNEEIKTLIQLINQSADLSMSIINDLVDAINVDRKNVLLKEDKIILEEIIKTALKMQIENLDKKKIDVQLDFFPGLEIKGDRNFIIRVLINLISNAVKFSNSNTQIQIETSLFDENNVMIKIKDHGIGIDKDKLLTIFEPFTSASRRGVAGEKSIGLGLSICKKIVELHHGKIWVESKVNNGSEFYITLPINYLNQILKNIPVNF